MVVKGAQTLVGFALAAFAVGKFIGRKPFVVAVCAGQCGRLRETFRSAGVIVIFIAVKSSERFIELWFLRIIFDPTFEEIFSDREIFALRFDTEREPRLRRIVQRGGARVPGHVPRRQVPEEWHMRLQGGDLPK